MKKIFGCLTFSTVMIFSGLAFSGPVSTIVPYGNGTWTYDTAKPIPIAGQFAPQIASYNNQAPDHQITQLFFYGGDIEMYCRGSGGSSPSTPCTKNNIYAFYNTSDNPTAPHEEKYAAVPGVKNLIPVIDGRLDNPDDTDILNHLNDMPQAEAILFADIVAAKACADDRIDGIQFDIEPFSFTGGNGSPISGLGQQYFYTEIAKVFAGWYGQGDFPGVNTYDAYHPDPLKCVSKNHPNGRVFSVFSFSSNITPDVVSVFNYHGNGYVVDSLYDLGNKPGGTLTTPQAFEQLVTAETKAMSQLGVPYQFAIPGAASAHEYESAISPQGIKIIGFPQVDYINGALTAIAPYKADPNFKGIALWSWNPLDHMNWNGWQMFPGKPTKDVLSVLAERSPSVDLR